MTIHLPEELERFIQGRVQSGRFASETEAVAEAVRLLRHKEQIEEARVLEGIRRGLEDVKAGRTQPIAAAFTEIRRDLHLPHDA